MIICVWPNQANGHGFSTLLSFFYSFIIFVTCVHIKGLTSVLSDVTLSTEPNQTSGPGTSGPHWPPQTHSRSLSDTRIYVFDSIKSLVFLSLVNLVFALAKFTSWPGFSLCWKIRVVNVQLLCLFSSTFHENTLHKSRHYLSKHLTRKARL